MVPQDGSAIIATASGAWRFESAKFAGAGSYEVVATAVLGNASEFRSVHVSCTDKSTAYRQSIVNERERRGAPPIVWARMEGVSLPQVEAQLDTLQNQFYQQYLDKNDLRESLETVNLALNHVEPLLPIFPNSYNLQTFRAFMLKNYYMIMRDIGRQAEANWFLEEAVKMFNAIYEQNPNDASVVNGLGSVWLLRGNPQMALQYIDQALFLAKEQGYPYPEAEKDKELALAVLKAQEKQAAH